MQGRARGLSLACLKWKRRASCHLEELEGCCSLVQGERRQERHGAEETQVHGRVKERAGVGGLGKTLAPRFLFIGSACSS